jgi:gamma-glutamyltranspeptidase
MKPKQRSTSDGLAIMDRRHFQGQPTRLTLNAQIAQEIYALPTKAGLMQKQRAPSWSRPPTRTLEPQAQQAVHAARHAGGRRAVPGHAPEVFLNVAVFGMAPQAAIEAPRFDAYSYRVHRAARVPRRRAAHRARPRRRRRGRPGRQGPQGGDVADWTWKAGGVCTITIDRARGVLTGGADPRRTGYAIGW